MNPADFHEGAAKNRNRSSRVIRQGEDEDQAPSAHDSDGTLGAWLKSPALDFYAIAIIGGLLIIIGLLMVLSSSSVSNIAHGQSPFRGFLSQLLFAVVGLIGLLCAMFVPLSFLKSRAVALWIFVAALAVQALVFVPGIGIAAKGNRNWIRIGPFQGQPAEFLKLALALWLGVFLAKNRHRLREKPVLFTGVASAAIALVSVAAGRDLGTMMMMAAVVAGSMWVAGVPKRWFALAGGAAAVIVAVLVIQSPNRMARVGNWLHGTCEGDSCFQSQNGLMALAEGGWWGVGIGQSRQKWGRLPHSDNDFIFAIIGEELGLLGTLTILALFAAFALALTRMITRLRDPFVQITAAGIATWILFQAFVNMAVVSGLLPVLGVPLPFVSSGGSALVASMLALGLLLNFARNEPGAREALSACPSVVRKSAAIVADDSAPSSRRTSRRNRKA